MDHNNLLAPAARRFGRAWYVWNHGVLHFGLPMGVLSAIFIYGSEHHYALKAFVSWSFVATLAMYVLLVGPLAGFLFGRTMWKFTSRE